MKSGVVAASSKFTPTPSSRPEHGLTFQIVAESAAPWPAMKIRVTALLPQGSMPLRQFQFRGGHLVIDEKSFKTDSMDALLLRTLLQQPAADAQTYLVGPREFAGVLALLRQCSPACECQEDARTAQVEVLSTPARPALEIVQAPPGSEAETVLRVIARARYHYPESQAPLGWPLVRTASYWTFGRHVSPAPNLPCDAVLKEIFEAPTDAARTFSGEAALDLLGLARAAAKEGRLSLRLDEWLAKLNVCGETLKPRLHVSLASTGEIVIQNELLTPDGKIVSAELLPAPSFTEPAGANLSAATKGQDIWVKIGGHSYRLPADTAYFRLPRERRLKDDDIADFISDELPRLRASGAQIDKDVENLRVCRSLQPSIVLATGEDESAVQAQWSFETCENLLPAEQPENIAPLEILAAAAAGKRYLRRGNIFVRADREAVVACRKQIESIAAFRNPAGEARNDQIPELLAWAKKAASDVHTPWNVYVAEAVDGAHKVKDEPAAIKLSMDVEEDEGEPWFKLQASFDHGGEELSEEQLRELVAKGQRWFRKGDTWIKIDAEALKKFDQSVEKSGVRRHRGRARQFYYRFKPAARDRVTEIFSLSGTLQHAERYRKFLGQLRGFERIQPLPIPKGMALSMRPYQQQGFEWLSFLSFYGLNGILADDMGLGKTAQTIAAITRQKEEAGSAPNLIVTPTSLVDNWRNECQKFSPGLRVLIYRGSPQRRDKLRQELQDYDVILGTYATVRNDASLLRQVDWRYVILDEAHFIKNSAAATTKAVKTIPARHRLALTGTPIQNRLTELWSLFDFLMPDFLGRQMRFRDTYEDPIARMQSGRAETKDEQQDGEQAAEHLRERIKPFVLRRLKTDVAGELPPKIENDIFCTLTPEQVAHYRSFADSAEAKEAVSEISEKGADGACTAILAALTALRKICNHPDLMCLPKNAGRQHIANPLPGYELRSGKLEALAELLQQCREGGHRALIFCQLTTMLDILGHFLKQHGMSFLRIDGETPGTARQGLVEKFNSDTSIDAFLISTRAGGAGLNLTGADTVIFYDHDWNPANDQQAQDRAYRIGQKRTVNVYRLICKGTLEEKILRRQAFKKLLANSIVQSDVGGVKNLTREELLGLFTLSIDEPPAATPKA